MVILNVLKGLLQRWNLFKLTFAVTYKCNYKCLTCNIWKKYQDQPEILNRELKLDEIETLFHKIGKVFWISITGGEPFLRDDLVNVIEIIKENSKCQILNLTTNGFNPKLITKAVQEIAELDIPLTFVNVSIDGPPNIHNKVKGVDSYHKAIETLRYLRELDYQFQNLHCSFEYTISPFNAGNFRNLISCLYEEGLASVVSKCTLTIYHIGHLYDNYPDNPESEIVLRNKEKMLRDISDCQQLCSNGSSLLGLLRNIYLKNARNFLVHNRSPISCVASKHSLFIDPYGDIYPCIILNDKLTNYRKISTKSLKEISRQWQLKYKSCRKCWTPCEAYPSIVKNPKVLLQSIISLSFS